MRLQHLCFKFSTTVFATDVKTDQDSLGESVYIRYMCSLTKMCLLTFSCIYRTSSEHAPPHQLRNMELHPGKPHNCRGYTTRSIKVAFSTNPKSNSRTEMHRVRGVMTLIRRSNLDQIPKIHAACECLDDVKALLGLHVHITWLHYNLARTTACGLAFAICAAQNVKKSETKSN